LSVLDDAVERRLGTCKDFVHLETSLFLEAGRRIMESRTN
jgi:hypothetical protein